MMSFTLAQQIEIRNAINEAVSEALEDDTLSVRVLSSGLEFSPLQPVGMQINIRMSVQITERDKKESAPA